MRGWRPTLGQPRGATSLAAQSAERQAWGAQALGPQRWVQEGASGRAVTQGCPPLLTDDEKQGTLGTLAERACGGLPSGMAGSWGRGSPTPHKPRALRSSPASVRSREGPGGYFLLCPDCIAQTVPLGVLRPQGSIWPGRTPHRRGASCPGTKMSGALGAPVPSPSPQWGSVAVSPADLEVLGSPCACQPHHAGITGVFEHAGLGTQPAQWLCRVAATKIFRGEGAEQVDQNWGNSYLPGVLQAGSIFFVILENSSQKAVQRARCSAGNGTRVCRALALPLPCSPPQHDGPQPPHRLLPRAELRACRILASRRGPARLRLPH